MLSIILEITTKFASCLWKPLDEKVGELLGVRDKEYKNNNNNGSEFWTLSLTLREGHIIILLAFLCPYLYVDFVGGYFQGPDFHCSIFSSFLLFIFITVVNSFLYSVPLCSSCLLLTTASSLTTGMM